MGFPVPLHQWVTTPGLVRDYVRDTLSTRRALTRELVNNRKVLQGLEQEPQYGRKLWGLLCLEVWQQTFHDEAAKFRRLVDAEVTQ